MDNREKLDIVEIVSKFVDLQECGTEDRPYFKGLCPFHNERSPSFIVYPLIQRFYCYGCMPDGGDVVDFVAEIKGISREEALKESTYLISPAESMLKSIEKCHEKSGNMDERLFNHRILVMHRQLGVEESREATKMLVNCIRLGQYARANSWMQKNGY